MMAFMKILIISLIAAVQAGYARHDSHRLKMPNLFYPTPPRAPFHPGFGHMRLPTPPFLHGFGHPFMPTLPFPPSMIKVPTPGEIANMQPGPGRDFSAVAVKSQSGFTRDKDGNVIRTHGSTVVTNTNGDVNKVEVGNNPPDINTPIIIPTFPDFDMQFHHMEPMKMPEFKHIEIPDFEPMKMHEFKPIKMPEFKPIKMPPFKPIIIEPIDIEKNEKYVPNPKENFTFVHTESHQTTSNINGVESSSGGGKTIVNDNGNVQKEESEYSDNDKKAMKKKRDANKNKKHNEAKKSKKRGDDDDESGVGEE